MNNERDNFNTIPNLKDAHNNLHIALGEKSFQQYNSLLRQYFTQKLTKIKFDEEARKLLGTSEQIHMHNVFLYALTDQVQPLRNKQLYMNNSDEDNFDCESESSLKYAVHERYVPDEELVKMRVLVTAFQNDLDGAEEDVTKLITRAVKIYLKNILTAVISKNTGYKFRENNFQHAIGFPVADPWLRNYKNIIDKSQESNLEVNNDLEEIQPRIKDSLESIQQKTAFQFACSSTESYRSHTKISLIHLYEALMEDPTIINNHTIYSINLERILAKLEM